MNMIMKIMKIIEVMVANMVITFEAVKITIIIVMKMMMNIITNMIIIAGGLKMTSIQKICMIMMIWVIITNNMMK